ncbi:hypothetical protein BDY21DRAFT_419871 [Lineolata rhizophorae]|uniref:Polynucleotide 5'-hydroxyl-kinase GRC3 n=1 Tax=Lineolata rhizophorae TaxID=578093 RepID=A0A6A6P622_9PEZI|nr:hypothetical protein BDY21DRAFT_419871 [Lineolata rhizophorae]
MPPKKSAQSSPTQGEPSGSAGLRPMSAFAAARMQSQAQAQPAPANPSEESDTSSSQEELEEKTDSSEDPDKEGLVPEVLNDGLGYESLSDTEDYEEWEQRNIDKPPTIQKIGIISNWRPSETNCREEDCMVYISLEHEETFSAIGQYDLVVKEGIISIYGATLQADGFRYRIFAPATHALPIIRAELDRAEIEVRHCKHTMRGLKHLAPSLWKRVWNHSLHNRRWSFGWINKVRDDRLRRPISPLTVHESWNVWDTIHVKPKTGRVPIIMVAGGKASGKSTLCRLLCNHYLKPPQLAESAEKSARKPNSLRTIFFLDLDAGTPEFVPPGLLSLVQIKEPIFGPAFTHPLTDLTESSRIIRAHSNFGFTSSTYYYHYLRAANNLFACYKDLRREFPGAPLIVNFPGAVKGMGGAMLEILEKDFDPTEILYLRKPEEKYLPDFKKQPIFLESQSYQVETRTDVQWKEMHYMSYFHQDGVVHGNVRWNALPMVDVRPWVVPYGPKSSDILGIAGQGHGFARDSLFTLTNCNHLAVVVIEGEKAFRPRENHASLRKPGPNDSRITDDALSFPKVKIARTTDTQLPFVFGSFGVFSGALSPQHSHCIGFVFVRGIDTENKCLHVLTPIPEYTIQRYTRRAEGERPKILLIIGEWYGMGWISHEKYYMAKHVMEKIRHSQERRRARTTAVDQQSTTDDIDTVNEE